MKVLYPFKIFCFSLLLVALFCANAFSDFSASEFARQFNGLNNGQGFRYSYTAANGSGVGLGSEIQLSNQSGATSIDFSTYRHDLYTGGTGYMRTFCIEPNISTLAYSGTADLNYQNGQTRTSSGVAVKLGTAVLYSRFASGDLYNFGYTNINRSSDYTALKTAIQTTMGLLNSDWLSNKYLKQLLDINNDRSFWTATYDPAKYYQEVGDYAVFAMNVYTSNGANAQDFLYVTKASYGNGGSSDVPEPATILLWSLGTLGYAGASWRKRHCRKKKQSQHECGC